MARGPEPPSLNLADQLALFKQWGGDYSRHTTVSPPPPPPGFKMLSTPLLQRQSAGLTFFYALLHADVRCRFKNGKIKSDLNKDHLV